MKVVLFCGGEGTRIREYSESIPKPMVPVGYRPILWHVMKYYAHYGHRDFILALGYKADVIKDFFLNYNEAVSNDFVLYEGGKRIELANSDIEDWTITFVDTGAKACIGERLWRVRSYLKGEEMFLANYSDGVTDLPLDEYVEHFRRKNKIASFVAVQPPGSYHIVRFGDDDLVDQIEPITSTGARVNGGYFILKQEIFDYMKPGEELVNEPFQRLIKEGQLTAYRHDGFWQPMDTFKEQRQLDELNRSGDAPWRVWDKPDEP